MNNTTNYYLYATTFAWAKNHQFFQKVLIKMFRTTLTQRTTNFSRLHQNVLHKALLVTPTSSGAMMMLSGKYTTHIRALSGMSASSSSSSSESSESSSGKVSRPLSPSRRRHDKLYVALSPPPPPPKIIIIIIIIRYDRRRRAREPLSPPHQSSDLITRRRIRRGGVKK